MEIKLSGDQTYPISVAVLDDNKNDYISLIEFDDLLRKMVEFRVSYNEKECRDITEEVKEEDILGNGGEYGIAAFAEDWDEEDQAYEAERIAREEERLRNEYI